MMIMSATLAVSGSLWVARFIILETVVLAFDSHTPWSRREPAPSDAAG